MENKNYLYDAVALLKELIAIPSVSRDETRAADKLADFLNMWNLPFGREGNNLWVGCPDWDNNRPTVMLNAHIDTVKPVSSWTRDPFSPDQVNKTQLREKAGLTTNVIAKMGKNQSVQLETLYKICEVLDCNLDDISEIIPEEN